MRLVTLLGAAVSFALLALACPLHNPVPVEPGYPPPTPFSVARDAGRE